MNTTTRLAGFGVVLVVALGAGAALGATVGPDASNNEHSRVHTTPVACDKATTGDAPMEH